MLALRGVPPAADETGPTSRPERFGGLYAGFGRGFRGASARKGPSLLRLLALAGARGREGTDGQRDTRALHCPEGAPREHHPHTPPAKRARRGHLTGPFRNAQEPREALG